MRLTIVICALAFSACLSSGVTEAQQSAYEQWRYMSTIEPEHYVSRRAAGAIDIDGRIDEAAWQLAPWSDYFQDIEGEKKPVPRLRTRIKMLWDDYYFYIAAELEEPHVWGTLVFRDQIMFHENDFEIFIDPNSDNHEYYEIEISPMNAVWDLFLGKPYRDGGPAVQTWLLEGIKTGIHVNGTINDPRDTDKSWTIEFALPWDSLKEYAHRPSPPADGDIWRINFSRVEWEHEIITSEHTTPDISGNAYKVKDGVRENNWVWSPQGVINMHAPEKWGYVMFSDTIRETVAFRPDPTTDARNYLMGIYHAQRDYRQKNNRYADMLEKLDIDLDTPPSVTGKPSIETMEDGYRVSVEVRMPDGDTKRLVLTQDSRLVLE